MPLFSFQCPCSRCCCLGFWWCYRVLRLVLCGNGTSHTLGMLKAVASPLRGGSAPSCSPPTTPGQHHAAWLQAGKLDKTDCIKGSAACCCPSCQAVSVSPSVPCPCLAHVRQGSISALWLHLRRGLLGAARLKLNKRRKRKIVFVACS